jgi:thiol-disulfide isomerase/thioredoxin
MKKYIHLLLITFSFAGAAKAQLPDGSTVPDFTFADINGNTQNLYSYLNAGKYVAIDVFATWCHPCWLYHNTGVMDSLYNLHDSPGTNTIKVFGIEADGGTNLADVQGTGTSTQGDWTNGTVYPLMNPPAGIALNDFSTYYNISAYPTLYIICPNKKIYQDTLNKSSKASVAVWEYAANHLCGPVGLDDLRDANPLAIYPNPAIDYTVLYFSLHAATEVTLSVANIVGQTVTNKSFGHLQAGDHSLRCELNDLQSGMYFFTISEGNGRSVRKRIIIK